MTPSISIAPATTPEDVATVARLFADYAASLSVDLGYQDFDGELAALPGKYAPPHGALLLARDDTGAPLGCVALRPIDDAVEMKRLYLVPAARGTGLGRALAAAAIETARALGHRELRLDTLASMVAAQALYADLGFVPIAPYYAPTPPGTVFMALRLV